MKTRIVVLLVVLIVLAAGAWGALHLLRGATAASAGQIPTTRVKRGKVVISVAARGELQGGNSEMLVAPMTGSDSMAITSLREPGEMVKAGDTIVQFDT